MIGQLFSQSKLHLAVLLLPLVSHSALAQSLDGTWEITAVIDDGRVVEPGNIMLNYAADGRVIISGQRVSLVVPMTFQRKQLPFYVDSTKSPMTFDMAGVERTGGRGIFIADRDTLVLCLSGRERARPTALVSLPGSGNLLVTLRRISNDTGGGGGGGGGFPNTPAPPSYEDEQLRRMLFGKWGHQDAESIQYISLNQDGTFNATTIWKDNFKNMFHEDVHYGGSWRIQAGVVICSTTQATDKERIGQVSSFRVRAINARELTAVDGEGRVRQEWKAP
jgi:uncharacterized protein (TIGR03067 family)